MTKLIIAVRSSANARKNRHLSEFVSDSCRMCAFVGIRRLDNYRSRPVDAVCITQVRGAE